MSDTKTVTLAGEEIRVDLGRKHINIRNLGSETIYASVVSGIVPDADGVLGIPAGSTDIITNTDGYVYLKGNGKAQLVGSNYVDDLLGEVASRSSGSGASGTADQLSTARNIITNLESVDAASFDGTADITPGVSGILPITNGGTGNSTGYVTVGQKANNTLGNYATAEGHNVIAKGAYAHAENFETTAGEMAHAEGYRTKATGYSAHAEGYDTLAVTSSAHAEGTQSNARGVSSHAEGANTVVYGNYSHVGGYHTLTYSQSSTAIGQYNIASVVDSNVLENLFTVGNGTGDKARSNAFRVHSDSTVYGGTYNSTGADYAEYFEWLDDNIYNEDRRGRFVTLYGNKIAPANSNDEFILGIVSGHPSVIGDAHDDQWKQMYLTDIFGSPIFEDVDVPDETDNEGNVLVPAHSEHRMKLNPNYDNNQKYIPRSERPEWNAVGMMGKLVAVDDGTCEVNGWCAPSIGGIGTKSETQTRFRVMERLDETHVRILVL